MDGSKINKNSLEGKRVLITGGNSGIGAEVSRSFAREGAIVGIHYSKNKKEAEDLEEELSKYTKVKIYQEDFSSQELNLVKDFIKDFGGIDILINNAGVMANKSFFDIDSEEYDFVFNINARAPFLLSSRAFEFMSKQKYGRIVNISSFVVKYGMGRNKSIHYAASKSAVEELTVGISRIGAEYNITANTIRPGVVNTKMQKGRKDLQNRIDLIPMGRMAEPKEIAEMVLFLCSKKGDFITGQTISISGGD
jgi:3-oxoacyl-[acyl-carrier protein] reductase